MRIWCEGLELVQTTKKPPAAGLGLFHGAGDENRTRALSLGILRSPPALSALACADTAQCPLRIAAAFTAADRGCPPQMVRRWCDVVRVPERRKAPPAPTILGWWLRHRAATPQGVLQLSVTGHPGQLLFRLSGRFSQVRSLTGQSDSRDSSRPPGMCKGPVVIDGRRRSAWCESVTAETAPQPSGLAAPSQPSVQVSKVPLGRYGGVPPSWSSPRGAG